MSILKNKRILIAGLVSDRSIAYGIAQTMHQQGAELAFTFQNEKIRERVTEMAHQFNAKIILPCDVASDEEINQAFIEIGKHWDGLDGIVHSIAFAPAEQLKGDYIDCVTREGFRIAHDISSYSFAAMAKAGYPLMKDRRGALLTLTYLGSERAVTHYNVMGVAKASLEANVRYLANSLGPRGIRVNAISAGPIRTLAASGVKDLRKILSYHERVSPLRELTTIEQVGNAAAFLCSDLASGITGEIIHVDGGYHAIGVGELGE